MSVSSHIEIKFVFKEHTAAVEWFKKLSSSDESTYDYINEISFKRIRNLVDFTKKDKYMVYLNSSNRNYFYERWFLTKLLKDIPTDEIKPNDNDFCECFREINAKYKCAIDYITTSEYGTQDHVVWNYDGKIILEEENKIDEETNEHSNPDFNKQNIETLL